MKVLKSKRELSDYLCISVARLDHLFNKCGVERPQNVACQSHPKYILNEEYIDMIHKKNQEFPTYTRFKNTYKLKGTNGNDWAAAMEKRVNEL